MMMQCSGLEPGFGMARDLLHAEVTGSIIGAFYEVYNALSHGFLESLYMAAPERELRARGHSVARERAVRVMYKGEEIGLQRLDMIVDDAVLIEAKSTWTLHDSASRQLYNYLRASNLEVGLLLHFGRQAQFFRIVCENDLTPRLKRSAGSA
jgi:GxxExxY protein